MKYLTVLLFSLVITPLSLASDMVSISENKITLQAIDANLLKILLEIQTATGIYFRIDANITEDSISIFLDKTDINKAINRILNKYDKSYEYNDLGNLNTVFVHSKTLQSRSTTQIKSSENVAHTNTTNPNSPPTIEKNEIDPITSMDTTDLASKIGISPHLAFIKENQSEMIIDPPSYERDFLGIIKEHHEEMEVTESYHLEDPGEIN